MNKLLSKPFLMAAVSTMVFAGCQQSPINRLLGHSSGSSGQLSASGPTTDENGNKDNKKNENNTEKEACGGTGIGRLVRTAGPTTLPVEAEFTISSISTDGTVCPEQKLQSHADGSFEASGLAGTSGEATLEIYGQRFRIPYEKAIPGPADLGTTETCPLCA